VRLAAAAAPSPLPRLAIDQPALVAEYWVRFHADALAPRPFDLAAHGPMPVRLNGPGLIWSGDRLLDDNEFLPVYVRPEIDRDGAVTRAHLASLPLRREVRPALVFHGWGVRVYGHFLIEMLPKLLLAARFPALFAGLAPVLDRQMEPWLLRIVRDHCGIDPAGAIWFDSAVEQLALEQAVVLPLLTRAEGYHPITSGLIDGFIARVGVAAGETPARLFVARGDFSNPAAPRRRLVNEEALAMVARERFGFSVIHPEQLDFAAQVGLFARARTIIGQAGSGMHNALFAPAGARVGMIRFPAPDQSAIAALRGQRIAYLTEGISEIEPAVYQADPALFGRFVAALLDQP